MVLAARGDLLSCALRGGRVGGAEANPQTTDGPPGKEPLVAHAQDALSRTAPPTRPVFWRARSRYVPTSARGAAYAVARLWCRRPAFLVGLTPYGELARALDALVIALDRERSDARVRAYLYRRGTTERPVKRHELARLLRAFLEQAS
jgi:hypothetical protein